MSTQATLQGMIDKIVYKSDENGFVVLRLSVSAKELVTVTGYLPDLQSGEYASFEGAWGFHA